jgi:hypothetical protein
MFDPTSRKIRYQFAPLPDLPDLTALSADELAELESTILAQFSALRPTASTPEDIASLSTMAEQLTTVRAVIAEHAAQPPAAPPAPAAPADDIATRLAALDAQVGVPAAETPPVEPAAVAPPAAPATPVDAEGIAAAAARGATEAFATALPGLITAIRERPTEPVATARGLAAFRPGHLQPMADPQLGGLGGARPVTITAGADIEGVGAGSVLPDLHAVAEAMSKRWNRIRNSSGGMRGSEEVVIASIHADYPEERTFRKDDTDGNMAKLQAVVSPEAILASGGLCAPVAPYYNLMVIAEDLRPVASSLPTFAATRGGIKLIPPPHLGDLTASPPSPNPNNLGSAVGVETVSEDADGGLKLCYDVGCASPIEYDVEIIWRCLQFSNLTARTFPEQVDAFVRLTMAKWASEAETVLLTNMVAASKQMTFAKTFGTARQLLSQIEHSVAYYRNVNRTDPALTIHVWLPAWALNAMRVDLIGTLAVGGLDNFDVADAEIEGYFDNLHVAVTWYIDTPTGAGQTFDLAVSGDAMPDFPSTILSIVAAEGSFLHLDAGVLDLGLIRDSITTAQNKFRQFGESFENVAYVGVESLAITHTCCPDSTYAAAIAITSGQVCPDAGSGL